MKKEKLVPVLFVILVFIPLQKMESQTTNDSPFKISAEIVSHYIWRGSMATKSPTPNIQPTLAFAKGVFELGVWGSTDFQGSYKEIDPYLSVSAGQFKFSLTDYFWNFDQSKYFDYGKQTSHMFEGSIGFTGKESFPISISLNTIFFGSDKKIQNNDTLQAYSSYAEIGYTTGPAYFFFGFTPWESYYNNYGLTSFDSSAGKKSFSIVNVGVTLSKSLKITDSFSLPVRATLAVNPSATYSKQDYVHLVFGITL